jgi:ribosomal protein S18 acetylase RimI-like enzyme
MWVAPEARGAGVGDILVAAAIDWARAHGARRIELDVLDSNHHAIALYVRNGFVDIGMAVPDADSDRVERRMARDCP